MRKLKTESEQGGIGLALLFVLIALLTGYLFSPWFFFVVVIAFLFLFVGP